jgi:hypothetical protein
MFHIYTSYIPRLKVGAIYIYFSKSINPYSKNVIIFYSFCLYPLAPPGGRIRLLADFSL